MILKQPFVLGVFSISQNSYNNIGFVVVHRMFVDCICVGFLLSLVFGYLGGLEASKCCLFCVTTPLRL